MTHETAAAINAVSERLTEVERKLDNYFRMLHDQNAANISILAAAADDQMAARGIGLYPEWKEGLNVAVGDRLQYEGKLYKVIQAHTTQEGWTPDITASLFEVIDVEHAGTAEDPIPWAVNMQCYKGKYYTFDNVLYLCIRDSGIPLAYTPDQLLGNYFELA